MEKTDYIQKYEGIYANIVDANGDKARDLIKRLAEVLEMMDECKEHVLKEGCVSEMCQGNYSIERENPWSKTYDSKAKIMLMIIEKLDKMSASAPSKVDELMDYITK